MHFAECIRGLFLIDGFNINKLCILYGVISILSKLTLPIPIFLLFLGIFEYMFYSVKNTHIIHSYIN